MLRMEETIELKSELILLCEGPADQNFFRELIKKRNLPEFDILPVHGKDGFREMLKSVRGNPRGFSRVRGVLIVADSGDDPSNTFKNIKRQIKAHGYPVPPSLSAVASPTVDHPAVSVTLLPNNEEPGSLETLYVQELISRDAWISTCVDDFLQCEKIDAGNWPPEKRDKARFQCIIAARNREDPTRTAAHVYSRTPQLIDVMAPCFNEVVERLRAFCQSVLD
jgi:hypothetical protein